MENLPQRPLTPQEKKQYLLNKYVKRDYKVEDLVPKYAVYFNPAIDKINEWTLVCVCNDKNQALGEILWRKKYIEPFDNFKFDKGMYDLKKALDLEWTKYCDFVSSLFEIDIKKHKISGYEFVC